MGVGVVVVVGSSSRGGGGAIESAAAGGAVRVVAQLHSCNQANKKMMRTSANYYEDAE